jgi:hypothetical protein
LTDAMQRTVLFLDAMRQRSDQYYEQKEKAVPHVLRYDAELVLDGRTFARPANYLLVRIKPPSGMPVDPLKRPFVVVDPRPGTGRASAASRPTANWAWRWQPATRPTSSASRPSRCRARPSRT